MSCAKLTRLLNDFDQVERAMHEPDLPMEAKRLAVQTAETLAIEIRKHRETHCDFKPLAN